MLLNSATKGHQEEYHKPMRFEGSLPGWSRPLVTKPPVITISAAHTHTCTQTCTHAPTPQRCWTSSNICWVNRLQIQFGWRIIFFSRQFSFWDRDCCYMDWSNGFLRQILPRDSLNHLKKAFHSWIFTQQALLCHAVFKAPHSHHHRRKPT